MTNKLTGLIKEKTLDSIKIDNYWIKFFKKELLNVFSVGDKVEVNFKDNEKDGKVYHNGSSIIMIESSESIKFTKELTSKPITYEINKIESSTLNCLIMQSVQHASNQKISLKNATFEVLESYNSILGR
jgi:hypothetical protein